MPEERDGASEIVGGIGQIAADDFDDPPRNLVISGLAMLCAALLLGVAAWYLLKGGVSQGPSALTPHDGRHHPDRETESNILWGMIGGGIIAGFASLVFVMVGFISLSKAWSARRR